MTPMADALPIPNADWIARYNHIRAATEAIVAPLSAEDCQIQSMPDASPAKWHLAHSSWFFETFLLVPYLPGYSLFDPAYAVLFNSYYVGIGDRHPRPERGVLSRPTLDQVLAYRRHVDAAMAHMLASGEASWSAILDLGLHHEQQHQELILMDIQHGFFSNPILPAYAAATDSDDAEYGSIDWRTCPGGLYAIGHDGDGFAFDNEQPGHRTWLEPFQIADRLVTMGEYRAFIDDGGYRRPDLWLSDGWQAVATEGWAAPLYWRFENGGWTRFSLYGQQPIRPAEPVLHLSHYEADAYARWAGCRLPSEAEWEVAATRLSLQQLYDCAWQWTASPYAAYPGFRAAAGAIGEYNGKFMINQMVLRGGSRFTPVGHSRPTYRNFFPPQSRWMFSGIRLARDASDADAHGPAGQPDGKTR